MPFAPHIKCTNNVLAAFKGTSQIGALGQSLIAQEALLIERRKGDLKDTVNALRRRTDDSLVAVLSYTLYLLSNNLADRSTKEVLINIFQATEAEAFARALSSSSLLSARALVNQLMVTACEEYNLTLLEQLHGYGIELNMALPSGKTALQIAISTWGYSNNATTFVERLLGLGVDPALCGRHSFVDVAASNTSSQSETTKATGCYCCSQLPMLESAKRPDLVKVMLKNRARVCIHFDMTTSIERGADASLVQALLEAFPGLAHEAGPGCTYFSPLQAAIASYSYEVAEVLLNNGVAMALSYSDDLHHWWEEYCDTLDGLTGEEALVLFCSKDMRSPLALALQHGQYDMAIRILTSGADPNLCYLDLLDDARRPQQDFGNALWRFEIEEVTLEHWEDQECWICTPLQSAIVSHSITNVQVILDAGAELTCNFGLQPLVLAVMTGEKAIVQMLLASGAPVDGTTSFVRQGHRAMTPLAYASANGFTSIMEVLIHAGACINHCHPVVGLTPLQAAISFGAPHSAIELLLSCPEIDVWHPGSLQAGTDAFVVALCNKDHVATGYLVSHIRKMLARRMAETGVSASLDARMERRWHESCCSDFQAVPDGSCLAGRTTSDEVFRELVYIQKILQAWQVIQGDWSIAERVFEQAVRSDQTKMASMILQQGVKIPLRLSATLLDFLLLSVKVPQNPHFLESKIDLINLVIASQASSWANAQGPGLIASALSAYYYYKHRSRIGPIEWNRSSILLDVVKRLVSYGVEVNSGIGVPADPNALVVHTPMIMAVYEGDLEIIILLVEHRANVNEYGQSHTILDDHGQYGRDLLLTVTPLQIAALEGLDDVVDVLIQHAADVNKPPSSRDDCSTFHHHSTFGSYSALGAACARSNLSMVRKLIAAYADVNAPANSRNWTSLALSAYKDDLEIVLKLINSGANVNTTASGCSYARTALQAACDAGNLNVVTILINHNVDVNGVAGPRYGVTALQAAAMGGSFKICQMLVGCGAKVSAPASFYRGRTAVDGAAEHGGLDVVKFLLDHYDGDKDIVNICGKARWFARKEGHMAVDELLATYKQSAFGKNVVMRPENWRDVVDEVRYKELI